MLCHPPTKVLKCKRSLSTDGFVWELWQRWSRVWIPDNSHVAFFSFALFSVLTCHCLQTVVSCITSLDSRRSNCQECRLSSATHQPPPVTQHQGKSLGWATLHFSRQMSEIFQLTASDQMLEMQRGRWLWWDPHRPPGVKEAVDGLLKRYNSDPRPSQNLISPLTTELFHVLSLITIHCSLRYLHIHQGLTKEQKKARNLGFIIGI